MNVPEKFPLSWPQGYPVTEYRLQSRFNCTFAEARDGIKRELELLGATDALISCNVQPNRFGNLVEGRLIYNNPGVAVYYDFKGEAKVIACDKWRYIHENMRAVEKSIEAIRGLERWGCSDIISRAMDGMKALPAGSGIILGSVKRPWYEVLEVPVNATYTDVKNAQRRLLKRYHPDTGTEPSALKLQEVQDAFAEATKM